MTSGLAGVRRVLVVTKFRYLGDTIIATGFLRRLREALPETDISLLSGPAIPELMRGCPYLSRVITFDPGQARRLGPTLELGRALRRERFDVGFLLNRSLQSALVARLARIPRRIGFDTEFRGPLLTDRVGYEWTKPDRDCAMDLLRAVGIGGESALPELWVSDDERSVARERLASLGVPADALLVGIQAGANDPEVRAWGADRFAAVADHLAEEYGARTLLFGSREERETAERVAASMRRPPILLAGETTLREALALISLCKLWVGNDGGLLHAAVALGPATVGIFGPTKARRWGYDTARHRTMAVFPSKPASDAATIRRCLDAITVDAVYAEAKGLMEEHG